jgi:hypothetical protein
MLMAFELSPEKMVDTAIREAIRNGDVTPEDVMFYGAMQKIVGSAGLSDRMTYPSGSGSSDWGSNQTVNALDDIGRAKMFRQGRELARDDSLAGNVLMKYMVYLCGAGPAVELRKTVGEDSKLIPHPKQEVFDELFPDPIEASARVRLLIAETLKTGNIFCLHLPLESGFLSKLGEESYGYPQMRAIQPDLVTKINRTDQWSFTGPPADYQLSPQFKSAFPRGRLPAENVTHMRIFHELNDSIWGLSLFWTLSKEYMRYIDWLEQRTLKSRADNLVFLIRMREGAKSLQKFELPAKPMGIEINKDKEDLKTLSMAGGSGRDASDGDGYEFRLRLAQGVHLPENEVSENAQYAAQIGKYGFPAKMFEYLQVTLDAPLRRIFAKTIGVSPKDVIVRWPRVDTRDRASVVQELSTLEKDGDISKKEVRRTLGYSDDNVQERQEELAMNMGAPGGLGATSAFGMPSGGLGGLFGGGGLGAPAASAPGTSPVSALAPTAAAPRPAVAVKPAPAITGLTMKLPAAVRLMAADSAFADTLRAQQAVSGFGVTYEDITSSQLAPDQMTYGTIGCDYGYASEGAAVFGGFDPDGNIWVVGEATLKRVPSSDWVPVIQYVQERYPAITAVLTGSDEPELTDTLSAAGIDAQAKHIGEDRTRILIDAYLSGGKRIFVHEECAELLADLFQNAQEMTSGMATSKGRIDHRDAFRYMMIGLLEKSEGMDIGSPRGDYLEPAASQTPEGGVA